MQDNPFDEIDEIEQVESVKLVKKSERRAKKDQGYLLNGNLYQNKVINIAKALDEDSNTKGLFRYDDFLGRVQYTRTPVWDSDIKEGKSVDDNDVIYLKCHLAETKMFEPTNDKLNEGIYIYAAKTNKVHPVKRYLEGLKWDGVKRIDEWLPKVTGSEDNIYTQDVGRKMLCAMIQRIYNPGCQFDNLIVLEGKEGIYKTTMLRILGGEWYSPFSIKLDSKDAVDVMQGKWILELEELASIYGIEIEHVDAFLSRTVDRVRLSYRRNAQDFPRKCIFVGTMNPIGDNQYLKKQSENRRYWPIECSKHIDIDWLKENRDQLFAEAMTIYKKEKLYLDNQEAVDISINKQSERKTRDTWIDIIDEYLTGKNAVTLTELMTQCLGFQKDKISRTNTCRVGICMRQLHWLPRKLGAEQRRYYVRPDADYNDIETEREKWDEEE